MEATSPKSAAAITALLSMHHGALVGPLDCSTPALDLCTRKKSRSPSPRPEGARQDIKPLQDTNILIQRQSPNMLIERQSPNVFIQTPSTNIPMQRQSPDIPMQQKLPNPNLFNPIQIPSPDIPAGQKHSPDTSSYMDQQKPYEMAPNILYARMETDSSEEGSVSSDGHTDGTPYIYKTPTLGSYNPRAKPTRPFKAYPKDPFFLAFGASSADAMLGKESTEAYAEFRQKMLLQVRANNPEPGVTNAKMRRSSLASSTTETGKDSSYWEKRRKNNEAAKRSRDARRAKEDEIAIRAAFLEQENLKLKYEIASLRNETTKLRCLLYN